MKLPNGYGSVVKLSGKRGNPYLVRKSVGWHYDKKKDKQIQEFIIIGYTPTRAEGLQMLADYNKAPFDTVAAKMTFKDVYDKWSERKYSTVSKSNVNGEMKRYTKYGNIPEDEHHRFRFLPPPSKITATVISSSHLHSL